MIKSMTAYGRATRSTSLGRWAIEIHSVNRKFLDVSIHLPKDFLFFDIEVRKWLSQEIQRGQVTVKIALHYEGASSEVVNRQVMQLKQVKELFEKIADELGYQSKESITLPFLLEQRQAFTAVEESSQKEDLVRRDLKSVLEEALKAFNQMKEAEGKTLVEEIQKRLEIFQTHLREVEGRSDSATQKYRKRLLDRIQEAKLLQPEDNDRVLREVMIYAEKVDVTEEIARLHSHLKQFYDLFHSKEKSTGRTMDFLLQEMNREVNTMASKVDDSEISSHTVLMKSELEKIREQAQNIE